MVHDHVADVAGGAGGSWQDIALRLMLLLPAAVVAGIGLFIPWLRSSGGVSPLPRRLLLGAWIAGAGSALLAVLSVLVSDVNPIGGGVHAVLALAVPTLLRRPVLARWAAAALLVLLVVESVSGRSGLDFALDTAYVAAATIWFGVAALALTAPADRWRPATVRLDSLAISLAVLLTAVGVVQVGLSGIGFDRRLFSSAFGLTLLAVVLLPAVATVVVLAVARSGRTPSAGFRAGAGFVAAALLAWTALVAVPKPPDLPVPGVPLLASVDLNELEVPVLVSPQRPGPNLVHLPDIGGPQVTVTAGGKRVAATTRPGAQGLWAEVDLPRGRSDLVITRGESSDELGVDAGELAPRPLPADDGPECAAAALGSLVAERQQAVDRCPSEVLTSDDEEALRKLVRFLDSKHVPAITLVADRSPRGRAADAAVREEAGRAEIRVLRQPAADSALLVVSGWRTAHRATTHAAKAQAEKPTYSRGIYLAPWLLSAPIATSVASASVPLRFDPRQPAAVDFTVAVGDAFGGQGPTVGAYHEYLRATGRQADAAEAVRIFAVAQVNVMAMSPTAKHAPGMATAGEGPGHWIPRSTVIPVTLPLADASG